MIQPERIRKINDQPIRKGRYVVYWMQAAQRVNFNHALALAIEKANELDQPLLVYFELLDDYPDANFRHYAFMIDGLKEVRQELKRRGIKFIINYRNAGSPDLLALSRKASLAVADRGYTRMQKKWRREYARKISCPMIQVESDVIVPVETASQKEEYTARTIRPKIQRHLEKFLVPVTLSKLRKPSLNSRARSFDLDVSKLKVDRTVFPSEKYPGGYKQARKHLNFFIKNKLGGYGRLGSDPGEDHLSNMSPYLHFGQISPLEIALKINNEKYREELIVRRELAINFVHYNKNYDKYSCLPDWAIKTLRSHQKDKREYLYSRRQLENAETHDEFWNAAQKEMVITGKMHGYMRMYWGKKVLEWSKNPETAFRRALYLNNKYELDGRDPNGFAGAAWCFGKHDTAWPERRIFGKVRYMNANGLKRKFGMEKYLEKIANL